MSALNEAYRVACSARAGDAITARKIDGFTKLEIEYGRSGHTTRVTLSDENVTRLLAWLSPPA